MLDMAALMGTALHLVMQKWFSIMMPENFYGNWKCVKCGKILHNKYGLHVCKHCGLEMIYNEYSIEKSKHIPFSGHIDGILRFPTANYLLDFKGSYQDHMRDLKVSGRPSETHFCQGNSYACAINENLVKFGDLQRIHKIIIIYVERGRSHRLWEPMMVTPSTKSFYKTLDLIKVGRRSLKELVVPKGFCLGPEDDAARWCNWKDLCFSPLLESYLTDKVLPERKFASTSPSPLETLLQF